MARLPSVGGDGGSWGGILNSFLSVSLAGDGTLNNAIVSDATIASGASISKSKLSSAVQTSLSAADTSVQTVNGKSPSSGAVTLVASDIGALTQTTADGRYIQGVEQTSAPGSPTTNQLWYDSTNDQWKRWNGSAWVVASGASALPAGITGTGQYLPGRNLYIPSGSRIVKTRSKFAGAAVSTARAKIAVMGPSNAAGWNGSASLRGTQDYPSQVTNILEALGYSVSEMPVVLNDFIAYDTRVSVTGSWTNTGQPHAAVYSAIPNGGTMTFPTSRPADSLFIESSAAAGAGSFSIKIDGLLLTAANFPTATVTVSHCTYNSTTGVIAADSTNNPSTVTVTGLANSVHTLLVTATSASAVIFMADFYLSNSVSVANFGSSSSRTSNWADTSQWYNLIKVMLAWGPDVVILDGGLIANDRNNSVTTATTLTNLESIVTALRAAPSAPEVIIVSPPPFLTTDSGTPPPETAVWQNLYTLADVEGCWLVDNNDRWVSQASALALGMYGADNFHPNAKGYADVAQSLLSALDIESIASTESTPSIDMSDVTGSLSTAQLLAGSVIVIAWNGSAWTTLDGTVITSRPTSRTDICVLALLGTTAPSFLINNYDMWFKDNS